MLKVKTCGWLNGQRDDALGWCCERHERESVWEAESKLRDATEAAFDRTHQQFERGLITVGEFVQQVNRIAQAAGAEA